MGRCMNGIYLYSSAMNNFMADNYISDVVTAIDIGYSSGNTLKNNTMVDCGIDIEGDPEDYDSTEIDVSNTVNGKPVYYWKNVKGGKIPSDAGQVILFNCTDVVVKDSNLNNATISIILAYSSNITVINNSCCHNSLYGILLYKSDDNTIMNCNYSYNFWAGIKVRKSNDNLIIGNNCSLNYDRGIEFFWSSGKVVSNNIVCSNGGTGIDASGIISDNIVCSNGKGVFPGGGIYAGSNSIVYKTHA